MIPRMIFGLGLVLVLTACVSPQTPFPISSPTETTIPLLPSPTAALPRQTRRVQTETSTALPAATSGANNVLWEVVWSPNGKMIAAAFSDGVVIYDSQTQHVVEKFPTHGAEDPAFSADGKRVACLCDQGTLKVFSLDGDLLFALHDEIFFTAMAYSPDGAYLAAGNRDGIVTVWDANNQQVQSTFQIAPDVSSDTRVLRFGTDGKTLLAGSDVLLGLYDVASGKLLKSFDSAERGVSSSANLRRIVIVNNFGSALTLLDGETFLPIGRLEGANEVSRFTVSPDGKRVICACAGQLVFWDLEDGKILGLIKERRDNIFALSVSPDSKRLAIGTREGELKVIEMPFQK